MLENSEETKLKVKGTLFEPPPNAFFLFIWENLGTHLRKKAQMLETKLRLRFFKR